MGDPKPTRSVRPYLLTRPASPELVKIWEEFWVKYVLDLAEEENLSLISVSELRRLSPFDQMDEGSFKALLELLIKRGHAKWWDKKRGILRIYWCGPDYWLEKLLDAIRARSLTGVVNGVEGAVELVPQMASLPREEVEDLLELMVERGLAKWVDKKRKILRVLSP